MNNERHAFCIIAHENWSQLQKLVSCIDDDRNDIFLHIDAKSYDEFLKVGVPKTQKSRLYIVDKPINVAWSHVSLSDAEVLLFKKVYETGELYQYVHMLSGSDLPLRSMDEIHDFFYGRKEEFIEIWYNSKFRKRLKYYHFFVRWRRNNALIDNLRRMLLILQWPVVDRLKDCPLELVGGPSWCSITYGAMCEIIEKYDEVRKFFERTTCSDEHYKQMILYSSPKKYVFAKEGNLRYIRFDRGACSPRILTMEEYSAMMNSGCLFGRKFEEGTEVYNVVMNEINKG